MNGRDDRDAILRAIEEQKELSGRFRNLARLGTNGGDGNFSLIVKAHDQQTGQIVALKFYNPQYRKDVYRWYSFGRESELLQKFVGSPDILQWVAPIDSFSLTFQHAGIEIDFDFSFYAVELAASSVAAAVASGLLSLQQKLEYFRGMCRGIQRIHAAGVIHRDIKISNFLLMQTGAIKLCDFGTAKSLSDGTLPIASQYAVPVGDMTYAAPELFAALQDVDPTIYIKSDIYSLGAGLFEMLAGEPLNPLVFDNATLGDLITMMNAVPRISRVQIYEQFVPNLVSSLPLPRLSDLAINLPAGVNEILEKLYQSMCAIDYRRRLCDFNSIFSYINRALIILRNEEAYREWRKRRELYKRNAKKKEHRIQNKIEIGAFS